MFRPFSSQPAGRPIRPKPSRVALTGDDQGDDRADDDQDGSGIADALGDLPASEAGSIVGEAIRRVHQEMIDNDGRLPLPAGRSEPASEEELRKLKSELAEHAKTMPTMEIVSRVVEWLKLAISSRQAHDHGREVADAADAYARKVGFHPERINLSNSPTKPFRLFFQPRNVRRLRPCN